MTGKRFSTTGHTGADAEHPLRPTPARIEFAPDIVPVPARLVSVPQVDQAEQAAVSRMVDVETRRYAAAVARLAARVAELAPAMRHAREIGITATSIAATMTAAGVDVDSLPDELARHLR